MTESEYSDTFHHIVDEWLDAKTSGIGILLQREEVHNLRQLKT